MSDSEPKVPEKTQDTTQNTEPTKTPEDEITAEIVTDQDPQAYLIERYQEKFGNFL